MDKGKQDVIELLERLIDLRDFAHLQKHSGATCPEIVDAREYAEHIYMCIAPFIQRKPPKEADDG